MSTKLAGIAVQAAPEQIATTVGATQALDIVSRTLLRAADYGYVLENGRISVHGQASKLRDDPAVNPACLGGGH